MPVQPKTYRFRMQPKRAQAAAMSPRAGARRWVWNWALRRWKEHYLVTGKSITIAQLSAELTALKAEPETAWLNEVDSQALQQVLRDLHQAFVNFFEKRAGHPRFKSRKRDRARFRIPQRVQLKDGAVYAPKIGWVRIRQSREVEGIIKGATFKRDAKCHWYVTLTVEFAVLDTAPAPRDPATVMGIDLGLIDFVTPADGTKPTPAPKFHRKGEKKVKRAQRALSRRRKGSKRREKTRRHWARVPQKIANQRRDFLHKLTTDLAKNHGGVCIEDLSVRGLARTKLAKSFSDAAMGEFRRQLEYKCRWYGTLCVPVGRFHPSSQLCSVCGVLNESLTLADREWVCGCGAEHERDRNAAINIRAEGLRIVAAGQAETENARGDRVRPGTAGL